MASLHCFRVMLIEGTPLLIHHNSVFAQGIITNTVKLTGKITSEGPKGSVESTMIRFVLILARLINLSALSKYIFTLLSSRPAGVFREICPACLYNLRIHFDKVNTYYFIVSCKLSDHSPVSGAYHITSVNIGLYGPWEQCLLSSYINSSRSVSMTFPSSANNHGLNSGVSKISIC